MKRKVPDYVQCSRVQAEINKTYIQGSVVQIPSFTLRNVYNKTYSKWQNTKVWKSCDVCQKSFSPSNRKLWQGRSRWQRLQTFSELFFAYEKSEIITISLHKRSIELVSKSFIHSQLKIGTKKLGLHTFSKHSPLSTTKSQLSWLRPEIKVLQNSNTNVTIFLKSLQQLSKCG